jgi:3-deoxy-D-manno-octulosonate 8-phosphate phosphatase KdsC-like HAD superfamily phosphatase
METFVNVMKDLLVKNVRDKLDAQITVMEKENVNKMKLVYVIQDLLDLHVLKNS